MLPIIIINIVAFPFSNWLSRGKFDSSGSWMGLLLFTVLICTSIWLFLAAKVVERDVERIDQMAHYEQGLSEEGNGDDVMETGGVGGTPPTGASDIILNHENIYGQVSRKIDILLTPNDTPCCHPTRSRRSTTLQMTTTTTICGTSFLTNLTKSLRPT